MMAKILKKFYVFALFLIGIFFWALVKNMALPDPSSSSSADTLIIPNTVFLKRQQELIAKHLNSLEGEIASQKLYSNVLLSKIKMKFAKDSPDHQKLVRTQVDQAVSKTEIKTNNDDKLLALQRELQEEAHVGEVRSDIIDPVDRDFDKNKGHKDKDNDLNGHLPKDGDEVNGEVIDEHIPKQKVVEKPHFELDDNSVIAVLVFVCDRPTVKRSLDQLFKYRPSAKKFPIIVSQDCGSHAATTAVLESYDNQITHIKQPDLTEIDVPPKEKKMKGYYKISRHYGWALNHTFNVLNYDNVLIVEDDLDIAPDFFEYFAATLPIMKKDSSIWCVSAWNDNGKPKRINETAYETLHRTDFFPGLGWMMTKDLWKELMVKWPRGYWDDWMREPAQRRDRVCIRPEVSRTSTFGKEGVSHGTYYLNHLRFIKLNDHFVPFTSLDLSYLLKDNFDVEFVRRVYSSQLVGSVKELTTITESSTAPTEYRLIYRNKIEFRNLAKKLEIMEDFRAGVPRTAYRGVVPFNLNGHRCYLAPGANWESYQPF